MKRIDPKNLTAQLAYRGAGNPPTTQPSSSISNAFPGLEMDIRNLWRRIFEGITLHESSNLVIGIDTPMDANGPDLTRLQKGVSRLIAVAGSPVTACVVGPKKPDGPTEPLPDADNSPMALEWSNALAHVVHTHGGRMVKCKFLPAKGESEIEIELRMRPVFEPGQAAISRELSPPGQLSQSLCSPWQNDYRECACFYWAASRPDYVNVSPGPDGTSVGNTWMQKDRDSTTPQEYIPDDWKDERLVTYTDLFQQWEQELKFIIGGDDAE